MTPKEQPQEEPAMPQPQTPMIDAKQLFAGQSTVFIRHEGEIYRLLRTKNGKLMLQK